MGCSSSSRKSGRRAPANDRFAGVHRPARGAPGVRAPADRPAPDKKIGRTMIVRAPQQAARNTYDVIVIGGGILGCCHALEAAKRGLSVLLLERDDFGGATSWSSHRIIHGGLRYVQSLDFPRQLESIRERR